MGRAEYSRLDMEVSLVDTSPVVDGWSCYIEVKRKQVQRRPIGHTRREEEPVASLRMNEGEGLSERSVMSEDGGE